MLCWADKVAVAVLAIAYLFLVVLTGGHFALFEDGPSYARFVLIFGVAPWVVLRLFDWVIGGPARRRGVFTVRARH